VQRIEPPHVIIFIGYKHYTPTEGDEILMFHDDAPAIRQPDMKSPERRLMQSVPDGLYVQHKSATADCHWPWVFRAKILQSQIHGIAKVTDG
jgi:hypothetical protein